MDLSLSQSILILSATFSVVISIHLVSSRLNISAKFCFTYTWKEKLNTQIHIKLKTNSEILVEKSASPPSKSLSIIHISNINWVFLHCITSYVSYQIRPWVHLNLHITVLNYKLAAIKVTFQQKQSMFASACYFPIVLLTLWFFSDTNRKEKVLQGCCD